MLQSLAPAQGGLLPWGLTAAGALAVLILPSARWARRSARAALASALLLAAALDLGGVPLDTGDLWNCLGAAMVALQAVRGMAWARELGQHAALPIMSVSLLTMAALSTVAVVPGEFRRILAYLSQPSDQLARCEMWG